MGKWGTAFDILRDVVYGRSEFLDLYEQTTLHFIYRRTHFFGKEWERIPLRHFLEGVWSKDYGCITPRIRISEKKLLESLKSLETKTIIQVRRTVTKSNSYRIAEVNEIETGPLLEWCLRHQPSLLQSMVRQREKNKDILDFGESEVLRSLKEDLAQAPARTAASYPTGRVTATPPGAAPVPPPAGEHNLPIKSKKPMKVTPRRCAPQGVSSQERSKQQSPNGLRMLPRPIR